MSRSNRWVLLAVIVLAAIGLRFWRLVSLPPGFYYAEAFEGLKAWQVLTDPTYRPIFVTGNAGVPPLNIYANAIMFGVFRLFGGEVGPLAMRTTAACFGVLGVLALYALAVELQKLKPAATGLTFSFPLFAAGALAVMRWHFHFSRIGIEAILTPLLWVSATWLLLRGWRTGHWLSFTASGVMLAAAMYAYKSAWMIPLLMIPVAGLLLFQKGRIYSEELPLPSHVTRRKRQWIGLGVTATVAAVLVVPLAWFFWRYPGVALVHSEQLAELGDAANKHSILYSVWASLKIFVPFGETGDQSARHNLPGAPALNLWQAIPFYIGLATALWRIRQPSYTIVLIGLVGLMLPGVFTTGAPHFQRLLGVAAPAALLCGIGLDQIWQWGRLTLGAGQPRQGRGGWLAGAPAWAAIYRSIRWASVVLLVSGGIVAAREYFVQWAALPDLDDKFNVAVWEVGETLMAYPGTPVYLTPHSATATMLALALESTQHPPLVEFDGRHIFPLTAQVSTQPEFYLVLEQDDFRTRLLLPEIFPTVQIVQEMYNDREQVTARLYQRPAGVAPQRPPQHPLAVAVGDGIRLAGYDVQPDQLQVGKALYVQLHWLVQQKPTADWTVFTHLLAQDAAGHKRWVAGHDCPPGDGSLPTSQWRPGWRILDEYEISLPAELAAGQYELEIGLYQNTGEHLPQNSQGISLGLIKLDKPADPATQ